jgi:hypothetical protein
MKDALLAMLLEDNPGKKKLRSKEFTELLFLFAESLKKGAGEGEVSAFQMEAVGLFGNYLFGKREEKGVQEAKSPEMIFREIAEESDELFDLIEERANA